MLTPSTRNTGGPTGREQRNRHRPDSPPQPHPAALKTVHCTTPTALIHGARPATSPNTTGPSHDSAPRRCRTVENLHTSCIFTMTFRYTEKFVIVTLRNRSKWDQSRPMSGCSKAYFSHSSSVHEASTMNVPKGW